MKKLLLVMGLFYSLGTNATEYLTNPDGSDFYAKTFFNARGLSISEDGRYIAFGNNLFDRFYNTKSKIFPSVDDVPSISYIKMSSDARYFLLNSNSFGYQRLDSQTGDIFDVKSNSGLSFYADADFKISGDGSCMVFTDKSKKLNNANLPGVNDVHPFRYCFEGNELTQLPTTSNGLIYPMSVSISKNGDTVSFGSSGNFDANFKLTSPLADKVYAYRDGELLSATTSDSVFINSVVSPNGKYVFYSGDSSMSLFDVNLKTYKVLDADVDGVIKKIYSGAFAASGDGRFLIFSTKESYVAEDTGGIDFYVYDLLTSKVKIIPMVKNGTYERYYSEPVISENGKYIAFVENQNPPTLDSYTFTYRVITARNPFLDDDTFCKAY